MKKFVKKGFSLLEFLSVVIAILVVIVLLITFNAVRQEIVKSETQRQQNIAIVETQQIWPRVGDFGYLVLDGTKVQVIGVQWTGMVCVRHVDYQGRLTEVMLQSFELVNERPRLDAPIHSRRIDDGKEIR